MSPRRAQVQKRVDTNEEQVLKAHNDPLAELVANSEVCDAILLLAQTVTTYLKRQKVTLEDASVEGVVSRPKIGPRCDTTLFNSERHPNKPSRSSIIAFIDFIRKEGKPGLRDKHNKAEKSQLNKCQNIVSKQDFKST